ncbi:hypothetical protein COV49_02235 [Candidatus Falkowbacteria bacterium CG11_big_fil_rev_8_21_14_0_20_39_10]|uniref:Glycosyl transferase family 1 n=1 Tax=Candidatus Falkowbacteria bacterium CG11_big_fil_rev_8_21_14_0_20_39_10 TaxID=1974570 RepID=A0A2M6K947_9BACT|nr:MAG: hypothetical protein COV49_02235 [Candidatus Falkowbacteria bacterium CG11_big_fil_rev_8_21_14_0_20_39_10]
MLIGIDASRANRQHKTGTEWYSYYLIRNLAQIDPKNEYILYTDKPLNGGLLDLTNSSQKFNQIKINKKGYQTIKSPHNNFKAKILKWPFSFFWTLGRLSLEMLVYKPDVLFVPAHTLPLFIPEKTINTIHDVAFERDRYLYRYDKMGPEDRLGKRFLSLLVRIFTLNKYSANSLDYLRWSTRYALKKAKKIIAVSNFTKKEILEIYQTQPEKIKVIHNGYSDFLYKKIDDDYRIRIVLDKYGVERPYILYVGRLEKKKNTPALIEAFALAREKNKKIKEKLVLIGDAGFGFDEVKYMIGEYDLGQEVIIPGWVEEDDMPCFYSGATAFIFPSKHEGFGIPMLQAMGCQVPLAVSEIPVLHEVAGEAALFFCPYNTELIAGAIEKILTDEDLRKDLIKKGQERVKNFSWRKCAEETLRVIEGL